MPKFQTAGRCRGEAMSRRFKTLIPWLFLLLLAPTVASRSSGALLRLAAYPDCAKPCFVSAMQGGLCGLDDQVCMCNHTAFSVNITSCVEVRCTIPESLVVINTTRTNCGEPVRDRSLELKVATITVGTAAATFFVLRFGYKLLVSGLLLAMDDWFTLATMIMMIPSLVITTNGTTPNGLGRDIWTLSPDQINTVVKFFLITAVFYFLLTALVKLTFISFYLKVFPTRRVQLVLWGTFAVTTLWGLGFVLLTIFQCQPIWYFWRQWDGLHDGTCLNANAIGWANASSGIALDLWILAIPLLQLRKLQLSWKKKVGVIIMFLVGAFVTVISILRLKSLVNFAKSSNATWDYFDVTMWSIIEISVGIMCACLPAVRLLLVRMFPTLSDSRQRSFIQGDHRYSSGFRSRPQLSAAIVAPVVRKSRVGRNKSTKDGLSGIMLQKAYSVHYTEIQDERSVSQSNADWVKNECATVRKG